MLASDWETIFKKRWCKKATGRKWVTFYLSLERDNGSPSGPRGDTVNRFEESWCHCRVRGTRVRLSHVLLRYPSPTDQHRNGSPGEKRGSQRG